MKGRSVSWEEGTREVDARAKRPRASKIRGRYGTGRDGTHLGGLGHAFAINLDLEVALIRVQSDGHRVSW